MIGHRPQDTFLVQPFMYSFDPKFLFADEQLIYQKGDNFGGSSQSN